MSELPPNEKAPESGGGSADEADYESSGSSLSDALRISFNVLKAVMLVLVAVFFYTGYTTVQEGSVGVKVRFGKIVESGDGMRAFRPGAYMTWPAPIEEMVMVSTKERDVLLQREFFFQRRPGDEGRPLEQINPTPSLDPRTDGYLLTADGNIVHAEFSITYKVRDSEAGAFLRNVGEAQADRLVRAILERTLVRSVGSVSIDDFLLRNEFNAPNQETVRAQVQTELDRINAGLEIRRVTMTNAIPPLAVRDAFRDVNNAESERSRLEVEADKDRERFLTESVGPGYKAVILLIDEYERQRRLGATENVKMLEKVLSDIFDGQKSIKQAVVPWQAVLKAGGKADEDRLTQLTAVARDERVSGEASVRVSMARTYSTTEVNRLRGEVEKFRAYLAYYRLNPEFTRNRLLADVVQSLFTSANNDRHDIFGRDGATVIIEVQPDPRWVPERDRRRNEQMSDTPPGGPPR